MGRLPLLAGAEKVRQPFVDPELRRMLAQVGQNTFFRHFYGIEKSQVIDEIVRSTEWLSSRRIGSLIVVERGIGLKTFVI